MGKDTKERKEGRKRKGGSESFSGSEQSPKNKDLKQNSYPFVLFAYIYMIYSDMSMDVSLYTHVFANPTSFIVFLVGKFPHSLCTS